MGKKLTHKQQVFIEEYLKCWNATEAARRAGYAEKSIRAIASENLTKPDIQQEIQRRLKELEMEADEVLRGLADIARSSMGDFLNLRYGMAAIDLDKAEQAGKLHLIKKVSFKDGVLQSIELYDRQAALVQLGRHHHLFVDKLEVDWREELEVLGMSAGDLYEKLIQEIQRKMEKVHYGEAQDDD